MATNYVTTNAGPAPTGGALPQSAGVPNVSDVDGTIQPSAPNTQPTGQQPNPAQTLPQATETGEMPLNGRVVANPTTAQPPVHPAVQKAGIVRSIAQVLAGGPSTTTTINPDGSRTVTQKPLSRGDIGMAIALSALTGAFKGLGAKGPNAVGQAAGQGFESGIGLADKRSEEEQQQAAQKTQDLARSQGTLQFNMGLKNNAIEVGRKDREDHESFVNAYADQADSILNLPNAAAIVKGTKEAPLREDEANDIEKHSPFEWLRIPVSTIPRIDETTGKQAYILDGKVVPENTPGAHLAWDNGYILVNKSAQVPLSDENGALPWVKNSIEKWSGIIPGLTPSLVVGSGAKGTISAYLAGHITNQVQMLDGTQRELNTFTEKLNEGKKPSDKGYVQAISLKSAIQNGTVSLNDIQNFHKAAINSTQPDIQIDALRSDPKAKDSAGRIMALFGPENLETWKQNRIATEAASKAGAEQAAKNAADVDKRPVDPTLVVSFPDDIRQSYPSLTDGQIRSLTAQLGTNPTQKDYKDIQDRADKYETANINRINKEKANTDAVFTTPDALGFTPNVPGGLREYNKRQGTFKKNTDDLQKTEGTYQQFNSILDDVNAGKDLTGAQSVVALFNAIGISATPLAGKGFRINQNTIAEHAEARGLGQSLYNRLAGLKNGEVITPQQIKDYANIAMQARQDQYVNLVNQVHNQGLNADFVLPTGNGQKLDPSTAAIFLKLTGGDKAKARQAAQAKGWQF